MADRRAAHRRVGRQAADGQVAEEQQEQQRRGGEAGVPVPVGAPGRAAPEHAGDEAQRR